MSRALKPPIFAVFVGLAVFQPMQAQISGRVTGPEGWPIPAARVELLGPSGALSMTGTDSLGLFDLPAEAHGKAVRVTSLGMAPLEVPLGDLLHPMEIVLSASPLVLPPLETVATPLECPKNDAADAREVWTRAMARYRPLRDGLRTFAEILQRKEGVTRPEDFGALDVAAYDWAEVGGGLGGRWSPSTVEKNGYALRRTGASFGARLVSWEYLPLDLASSHYLALPWFADLQQFGFVRVTGDGTTVAFCDRRRRGPGISGRAYIDADGWVRKVEWRIETPEPNEEAGGEAHFAPEVDYLLPSSSAFWRRTPVGRYYQQAHTFSPWYVGDREGVRSVREERFERRRTGG